MKNQYSFNVKLQTKALVLLSFLFFLVFTKGNAQFGTPLSAGDVSIIGVNTNTDAEGIAFVIWKQIASGTEIRFTDNGFNLTGTDYTIRWKEQIAKWTSTTTVNPGTVITIANNVANIGTLSIVNCFSDASANWSLLSSGDQVFAYQGQNMPTVASSNGGQFDELVFNNTLLFGIGYPGISNTGGWVTSGLIGSNTSRLPTSLSSGNNHIFLSGTGVNCGRYIGPRTGFSSAASYREQIALNSNWEKFSGNPVVTYTTTTFELGVAPSITTQPSNKSICVSTNTTFSITANNTTSYQWKVNTGSGTYNNVPESGVYSGTTSNTLTITNATVSMSGYLYHCVATGTSSPAATSNNVSLTVNPAPNVTTHPSSTLVCVGNSTSFTTAIANATTYNWQVNNNSGSGFQNITNSGIYSGQGTITLTITGATVPMNGYTYRVIGTGNCAPAATSNSATLSVNASPSITSNPSNTTICSGSGAFFSITASNATAYQWQVNTGGGFGNLSNNATYSGANSTTLTISSVNSSMNNYKYQCVASSPCNPSATSSIATLGVLNLVTYYRDSDGDGFGNPAITQASCSGAPTGYVANNTDCNDGNASINPNPIVFYQNPSNSSICQSTNTTFQVTANADSYQWQVNSGSEFVNLGNNAIYSGVSTSTLTLTTVTGTMSGYQYRCVATKSCTSNSNSGSATLTVNPSPAVTTNPSSAIICVGGTTSFSAGYSNASSYTWQVSSDSGFTDISNGGVYSGQGTSTLTITNATLGMNNYSFRAIGNGNCAPNAVSNSASLTVNSGPSITSNPMNASVCANGNTSFTANASNANSYQWQVNTGSGFVNIANNGVYSGANSTTLSITGTTISMNGYLYQCVASGNCAPTSTSASASLNVIPLTTFYRDADNDGYGNPAITQTSCTGAPIGYVSNNTDCDDSNASVNPAPISFNTQPTDSSACEFATANFQVSANANGYQWQMDDGFGFIDLSEDGIHSGTDTNSLTIFVTSDMEGYKYRCIALKTCAANAPSNSATLSITQPFMVVIPLSATTVCAGNPASFSAVVENGISYNWQVSTGGAFAAVPNNGQYSGIGTNTLTILNTTTTMNGYRYRLIVAGNCASPTIMGPVLLTVNPLPAITLNPSNVSSCEGGNTTFSASASASTNYKWQVDDGNGFADLSNTSQYSGTATATLSVSGITLSMNYYKYQCIASGNCSPSAITSAATLNVQAATIYYQDFDGDGFGNVAVSQNSCSGAPVGYINNSNDCNDVNAAIHPNAVEIYGNNIDDNCNGTTDTDAADCSFTTTWNGTSWNPFTPVANQNAVISGDYSENTDLSVCSLEITNNAEVIISSGHNLSVTAALHTISGTLAFEHDAHLFQGVADVANSNTIDITYTRQSEMRRLDYTFWSSPVQAQNLKQFSLLTLSNRFYTLNETNVFTSIDPELNDFIPGHGYMIRAPNTFTGAPALGQSFNGNFTGIPNNGTISSPINANGDGFNLIGNPYPSTIDAFAFLEENPGTLYFWEIALEGAIAGAYSVFNEFGAVASPVNGQLHSQYIKPGQGFILQTNTPGNAVFKNQMRVNENVQELGRAANTVEKHRIWLNLSSGANIVNQILIGYMSGATNDVDNSVDGKLFVAGSSISSIIGNDNYHIQGRAIPFVDTDEIPLHFNVATSGNYSLSIENLDGLFLGQQQVFIKDNLLGITHDIKESAYNFASDYGSFSDRFTIVFQNTTLGIENPSLAPDPFIIFKKDMVLNINSGKSKMKAVKLFDVRGRLVFEDSKVNATNFTTDLQLERQVLIVQITDENDRKISKKIVF